MDFVGHPETMAKDQPTNFTKEEVLPFFTTAEPTDPSTLTWAPIAGLFGGTLRLRLHITEANLSPELLDAIQHTRYPEADVPEVVGLRRILVDACANVGIPIQVDPGPRELQKGMVGFFEPFTIRWPFAKARLAMTIAPGEFQWNLLSARKETGPDALRLESFKHELLERTRTWLRNGNR
jgi:hypothetical protein